MIYCANPQCQRPIVRPGRKYCSGSCAGATRQAKFRQKGRNGLDPLVSSTSPLTIDKRKANAERLRARPLARQWIPDEPIPIEVAVNTVVEVTESILQAKVERLAKMDESLDGLACLYHTGMLRREFLNWQRNKNYVVSDNLSFRWSPDVRFDECSAVQRILIFLYGQRDDLRCEHGFLWYRLDKCEFCETGISAPKTEKNWNTLLSRLGFSKRAGLKVGKFKISYQGDSKKLDVIDGAIQRDEVIGGRKNRPSGAGVDEDDPKEITGENYGLSDPYPEKFDSNSDFDDIPGHIPVSEESKE